MNSNNPSLIHAIRGPVMLITVGGQMVRITVDGIRETGRNAQGVKLIELEQGDRLKAIAPVISEEGEENPEVPPAAPAQ